MCVPLGLLTEEASQHFAPTAVHSMTLMRQLSLISFTFLLVQSQSGKAKETPLSQVKP